MNGILFLIVGPSGVGKGTVISKIKEKHPDFFYPVSCTTRDPRPGEKDDDSYHFISKKEFEYGIKKGKFLEYARVHSDNYYGTLKEPIMDGLKEGKIIIREIDIQGFQSIKKLIPKENLVSIFLYVASWEVLKSRIIRRHPESEHELNQREQSFKREMELKNLCDYQVDSPDGGIDKCIEEVEGIVLERSSK